jgi:hypothetical protein
MNCRYNSIEEHFEDIQSPNSDGFRMVVTWFSVYSITEQHDPK